MNKHLLYLFIFVFALGYIVGSFHEYDSIKKSKKTNEVAISKTETDYLSHHYKAQTERTFDKGQLIKEVVFSDMTINENKVNSYSQTRKQEEIVVEKKVEKKNWILNAESDPIHYQDISKIRVGLSYRVIGDIYLTGSINEKFDEPKVGISIAF